MSITIDISEEAEVKLKRRADEMGKDFAEFVEFLIEREAKQERRSLEELIAPVHAQTRRLGLSEKEIEDLVDSELAAYRREKPLRCQ